MTELTKPEISVIFPLHSGARYLREALDSTLAQKVDVNLELVVALDRTDSECLTILGSYHDKRIRVVSSPTPGVANAHNAALFASQGDFIAVMHSDDIMLPGRLSAQFQMLRADVDLVCVGGQLEIINSESEFLGLGSYVVGKSRVRKAMKTLCSIAHPAAMYRREVALNIDGYRQSFAPAEDYDLWLRMLEFGELDNLPIPVLQYRRHQSQISSTTKLRQVNAKYDALDDSLQRHRGKLASKVDSFARSKHVRFEMALDSVATFRLSGRRIPMIFAALKALAFSPTRLVRHLRIFVEGQRVALKYRRRD